MPRFFLGYSRFAMLNQPASTIPISQQRARVLYLSFNIGFMNPTRQHLISALAQATDLRLYGPGHVDRSELDRGVQHVIDTEGPFDFVITDEYVLQNFDTSRTESNRFVNHACRFDRHLLIKAVEWREFMKSYSGRRIITLLQSDYYNFQENQIERLESLADHYITWGSELIWPRAAFDRSQTPVQGIDQSITERWTDRYRDFTQTHKDRLISCPHFVGAEEFGGPPLARRKVPWANLGADYTARVVARTKLDGANLQRTGRWIPQAFSVASRLKYNVYSKYWTIELLQWGFRRAFRQAKYAFTCGSVLRWPIRKYFEIPANGAVLVCERPEGFEALGFEDRRNAVVCNARDILDAHAWLEANPTRAQEIADAGQDLVLRKHSVEARSQQIGAALRCILEDNFAGSRWHKGEFELVCKC